MKFGLIANPQRYSIVDPLRTIASWMQRSGFELNLHDSLCQFIPDPFKANCQSFTNEADVIASSDLIISLGGDGTMLWTARLVKHTNKPILGVNSGRLGFLANTQIEEVTAALDCVSAQNFSIDERRMIHLMCPDGAEHFALNEILFARRRSAAMISLVAYQQGNLINKFWADGLIVSTPTGSTAYNLSAGGPIVHPSTFSLVLTPISPHTLTARPIVLPATHDIEIEVPRQSNEVLLSVDGRDIDIVKYPFRARLTQSDFSINLIELPGHNFFETLRNKLMWGRDYREK